MAKTEIPPDLEDILHKRCYASVATLRPDGMLSCNPISIIWDGEMIRFSSLEKQKKIRNLRADPRIALSIIDPDNPVRYLEIRGTAEIQPDDDRSFVNQIAKKYVGVDEYPFDEPGAKRVVVTVHAERVSTFSHPPVSSPPQP